MKTETRFTPGPRKFEIDGKERTIASVQDLAEVIIVLRDR